MIGVYFIDQYNFPGLCDHARSGDSVACDLLQALLHFVEGAPQSICSICTDVVPIPEVPTMTIVIMHSPKACLTTWICEACSTRDDLETEIRKTLHDCPAMPDDAVIELLKRHTLH